MGNMLEIKGLCKSYGDVRAVQGVDFAAAAGALFALLGPNGAGKSTIISICCTHLRPDGGTVRAAGYILGKEDAAIRREIGVVFQEGVLDALLTVRENLLIRGSLYRLRGSAMREAAERAAEAAGAKEFWLRPYGKLSGGQRRRADIARALVHAPRLLFLDEPTTGLDPQTRFAVWETVRRLQAEQGMTVFLTTHYMEEAARADQVVVIDHGTVAAEGTPAQLREQYTTDLMILRALSGRAQVLEERLSGRGLTVRRQGETLTVTLQSTVQSAELLPLCRDEISQAEVRSGTMDDAFLAITGREVRK
ncbi:MAG: ATP-binding cassette domain-containing protein [Oscillospiraceae bacterium]|jgi:multidrug/hemolysin transport system ATP-binding protein|nr:ATP-binding cassette domain-containing protein [Oscillospiraceae bacterium]